MGGDERESICYPLARVPVVVSSVLRFRAVASKMVALLYKISVARSITRQRKYGKKRSVYETRDARNMRLLITLSLTSVNPADARNDRSVVSSNECKCAFAGVCSLQWMHK